MSEQEGAYNPDVVKEREKQVTLALADLQIQFADKLFAKADKMEENSFAYFLDEQGVLLEGIREGIMQAQRDAQDPSAVKQEMDAIMARMDTIYEAKAPDWHGQIMSVLEEAEKKFPRQGVMDKPKHVGLIEYVPSTVPEAGLPFMGLKPGDSYLEIHLQEAYKNPSEPVTSGQLTRGFGKLAETIVKEMPATRGVTGYSWLMDTPIAKRLGFEIVPTAKGKRKGPAAWFQFLDKNGKLEKKRVEQLLREEKLPYEEKRGAIPVEAFLQRYLPAELRGKPIVLKEVRPDWKDPMMSAARHLGESWGSLKDAETFLAHEPEFVEALIQVSEREAFMQTLQGD